MAKLTEINDKAVNDAIKNMHLDFNNSPIKGNTPFVDMVRRISSTKKINLENATNLYIYVEKALRTQNNCLILSNQNFIDMQKEWLTIMEWLKIYFKVDEGIFTYATVEEVEDALLDKYQDSEEYLNEAENQAELDASYEAEFKNNEVISHHDYPQDFS